MHYTWMMKDLRRCELGMDMKSVMYSCTAKRLHLCLSFLPPLTLCSILGMFYTLYSDNTVEYGDEYAGLALKLPWLTDPSRIGRHE